MKKHWEHKGAKYTKAKKPVRVEMTWECSEESGARKLEYAIKKELTKEKKEELIKNPTMVHEIFKQLKEYHFTSQTYQYGEKNGQN